MVPNNKPSESGSQANEPKPEYAEPKKAANEFNVPSLESSELIRMKEGLLPLELKKPIHRPQPINRPVLTANLIDENELLIQMSGKPRAGATRAFTRLLEKFFNEEAPPAGITLQETTIVSRADTASSTYLFTHDESDREALQQFADKILEEFQRLAFKLPQPSYGTDFQMSFRIEPDKAHQLNAILNYLETKVTNQEPGSINLTALDGRRYYQGKPGAEWYCELRFVISFPENIVHPGDIASHRLLEAELRELGMERGEVWVVDVRPYMGQFIDVLADHYGEPGPLEVAREDPL